ncbi:hypothetical protein KFK09_021082 [Dendrobium nobile]|uniref:DUF4283 domain-containing protein n=1 Tax=Dendrobium nobile TaxID=94219 RepID=A0A8T3APB0_DENNO|nr:hypothetical protein KFK09_021082 [Dendrobium nobile]
MANLKQKLRNEIPLSPPLCPLLCKILKSFESELKSVSSVFFRQNGREMFVRSWFFGRPLKVDNATSVGSRPFVARVLVELDMTKSYPDKVWLGLENLGYIQHVSMEAFPSFWASCKCLGHLSGDCRPLQSTPPNVVPVVSKPLTVNVSCEGDKVENIVSCDANEGALELCPAVGDEGNVAGIDTTVSNSVNEVINIGSDLPNALKLTCADVEAYQLVSEIDCVVASEMGDVPMALADALDGLDTLSHVMDGGYGSEGAGGSNRVVVSSELQNSPIATMEPLVDVPIYVISNADWPVQVVEPGIGRPVQSIYRNGISSNRLGTAQASGGSLKSGGSSMN